MIEVTVTTEVDVPAEVAFAYLADVTNNPEWQHGVKSTKWTSTRAGEVGATYDQRLDYRNQVTSHQVTALDPGRSISVKTVGRATIPTSVTRAVEPRGEDACTVSVTIVGEPSGLRRLSQRAISKAVRRSTEVDYTVLKRKLEGED
jgi:uncharacterized membrane protein